MKIEIKPIFECIITYPSGLIHRAKSTEEALAKLNVLRKDMDSRLKKSLKNIEEIPKLIQEIDEHVQSLNKHQKLFERPNEKITEDA